MELTLSLALSMAKSFPNIGRVNRVRTPPVGISTVSRAPRSYA